MITSGGTTTLGLYGNASEIRKKADITYVDSRVGDFQAQVVSLAGGHLGYATLALATTASTGLPANTIIEVTNDPTTPNNGLYLWNGTTLTKSAYDPLTQAKADATTKANAAEANVKAYVDEKIEISLNDPEYVFCISDRDSTLLLGITHSGVVEGTFKISFADVENVPESMYRLSTREDAENAVYEIVDEQGNILASIDKDGALNVSSIRTGSIEVNGANPQAGLATEAETQSVTKDKAVYISEQNYLRLDLDFLNLPTDTSVARTPTWGTCKISDASKTHVYVNAKARMGVQGHGSASDSKKNFTLDFFNTDDDDLEIKFGDMIASSSYHLKGFWRDPSHMRDQGGYRCWKELVQKLDYPYSKINNIVYSADPARVKDADFTADAKYYPHGFPVEVYWNGIFYGLSTLRLKKTRANYALNNANLNHIFLDSGTYTALLKEPFDATDWEIKSPKMKGYSDLGLIPPAFDNTVKASCTRLFEFTSTLSTSYPNHADYIVLPHWILWYLMCELTGDWDHNGNNYSIITWNNQQWSIFPYDLDWTLNWYEGAGATQSNNLLSVDIWTTFRTVFAPQIKAMWTKYRKNGDITVENVVKHYRGAVKNVPRKIFEADKEKWGGYPSFSAQNYPNLEQTYVWFQARIAYLDSKYLMEI